MSIGKLDKGSLDKQEAEFDAVLKEVRVIKSLLFVESELEHSRGMKVHCTLCEGWWWGDVWKSGPSRLPSAQHLQERRADSRDDSKDSASRSPEAVSAQQHLGIQNPSASFRGIAIFINIANQLYCTFFSYMCPVQNISMC